MSNTINEQMTALGVVEKEGKPVVSSKDVARVFEKKHKNVIRDIRLIVEAARNGDGSILSRRNILTNKVTFNRCIT
jgi:phage regulator Rha-like protein